MDYIRSYLAAALTFADLVDRIPPSAWNAPGSGVWDVRALVGHTAESLRVLPGLVDSRAPLSTIRSPRDYHEWLRHSGIVTEGSNAEAGFLAGQELGPDAAATVRGFLLAAQDAMATVSDPVVSTPAGGMYLHDVLPTLTFELAVHSLDVADAVGAELLLPDAVVDVCVALASPSSEPTGHGVPLLRHLTGRDLVQAGLCTAG